LLSVVLNYIGENIAIIQFVRTIDIGYYEVRLDKQEGVGSDTGFIWLYNIIVLIIYIFKRKQNYEISYHYLFTSLFVFGVFILNLRVVSDWFYRLSLYFTFFYIILTPFILEDLKVSELNKFIDKNLLSKLYIIPILYYLFILYSYSFREVGLILGSNMYDFIDLWK
jgi:hypothetical protein